MTPTSRPYLLLAWLLLLPACSILSSETPPVADSTMVEVLVELRLADARQDLPGDPTAGARDSILSKYHLSERLLQKAADYYAEHPDVYLEIYTKALDRLNAERSVYGNIDAMQLLQAPPDSSAR